MLLALSESASGGAQQDIDPGLLAMIRGEREKALSTREWQFRLRGYGYAIKTVEGARVLTQLPRGTALGVLPTDLD